MVTNCALDDKLVKEAQKIGKHKTKKGVVTEALLEYITHRKQMKIIDLFNTIDYDPEYNYKTQRKVK